MNNNDYTVVPLKKAVVNKYINFAKKYTFLFFKKQMK